MASPGVPLGSAVARAGLVVALLIVSGTAVALADLYGPPPGSRPVTLTPTGGGGVTAADCAALHSNASLNATLAGVYAGVPGIAGQDGGPNRSAAVNLSAYPALATAAPRVDADWWAICSSATFDSYYTSWGRNASGSGFELNASGFYQLDFDIEGPAVCPNSGSGSGGTCDKLVAWSIDLSNDRLHGPFAMIEYPLGGAPLAPPVGLTRASNSSWAGTFWYNYSLAYPVPVGFVVGGLTAEVKTFSCGAAAGVTSFEFSTPSSGVFAVEDPGTHLWTTGANASIPADATFSIVGSQALVGDELILASGSGSTGQQIVASTAAWEGCAP